MNHFARILAVLGLICSISCLSSCSKLEDPVDTPVITHFLPHSGLIGSGVTIYGNHFIPPVPAELGNGPFDNTSMVTFNGVIAEAENVYQDSFGRQRINTSVPPGATSGPITVTVDGVETTSMEDFVITTPTYLSNVSVTTFGPYYGIDLDLDSEGNF